MMHLILSPVAGFPGDDDVPIHVDGDTLTYDGAAYDLSAIPEGGQAEPEGEGHPFIGPITRVGGKIHATIIARYNYDIAEPDQPTDWDHWTVPEATGDVEIPTIKREAA